MALCSDRSLTYLNDLGYNVVRLPRRGIDPMDVLGRDGGRVERLGRLEQIWASTKPVPTPAAASAAAQVSGQRTSTMSPSIGLNVLNGVLAGLGAQLPRIDFAYSNAKSLQFTFGDVTARGVDAFAIGEYLGNGDLKGASPVFDRYFHDDDTEAFVVTDVLEARSIAVSAKDEGGGDVKVDVPAIQQVIGANVGVTMKAGSQDDLSFTGTEPVTFGFKALHIAFDGRWRVAGAPPTGALSFGHVPEGTPPDPVILKRGGTVAFRI